MEDEDVLDVPGLTPEEIEVQKLMLYSFSSRRATNGRSQRTANTTTTTAVYTPPAPPKRKPAKKAEQEFISFVVCTKCSKWRRMLTKELDPIFPEKWFCSMSKDEKHNTCEAEQEVTDEEVEIEHQILNKLYAKQRAKKWSKTFVAIILDSENENDQKDELQEWLLNNDDHEIIWLQCGACKKWRRIIAIPANVPDYWRCSYASLTCSFPQEKTEEEMEREVKWIPKLEKKLDNLLDKYEVTFLQCKSCKKWRKNIAPKNADYEEDWICEMTKDIESNYCDKEVQYTKQQKDKILLKLQKKTVECVTVKKNKYETGCTDDCVNKLLKIECDPKYCPCKESCTNQKFQKTQNAKYKFRETGKKGWGLEAAEDIEPGSFVIEYVGEVIPVSEYEQRLAERNDFMFYYMRLDAGECLDASRIANDARFINHSCDPNLDPIKWEVEGEICVGLFANQKIKSGTEFTFDYDFEIKEEDNDKKQKCYCGAKNCRQYLGAKKPVQEKPKKRKISEEELQARKMRKIMAEPQYYTTPENSKKKEEAKNFFKDFCDGFLAPASTRKRN